MKKFKQKKAKKSISSLVLASSAASSVAFPYFYDILTSFRSKTLDGLSSTLIRSKNQTNPVQISSSYHRSKSMYVIPSSEAIKNSSVENLPGVDKRNVRISTSNTLKNEVRNEPPPLQTHFPMRLPTKAPSNLGVNNHYSPRNVSPIKKRIFSAPANVQQNKLFQESLTPLDKLLVDEYTFEEDNFHVGSVKAKAERWKENKIEKGNCKELDEWDDDFDGLGVDIEIPTFLDNLQGVIKKDALSLKTFSLHIEDLKLLFLETKDMAEGLSHDHPQKLMKTDKAYKKELCHTEILIHLSDQIENNNTSAVTTSYDYQKQMDILSEILRECLPKELLENSNSETIDGDAKPDEEDDEDWTLNEPSKRKRLIFDVKYLPYLVKYIAPLKQKVASYTNELRKIAISA